MKKLIIIFLAVCTLGSISNAQVKKDERTLTTKIADLLAQMPASNIKNLDQAMEEAALLGEKGLADLVSQLVPPGKGDNSRIEYAAAGFSAYASKPGRENLRQMAVKAYCEALSKIQDKDNKAFIISQLQVVGNDAAVSCLQSYLSDERLADPAARALASIGTASAGSALLNALSSAQGLSRVSIAEALGDMRYKGAVQALSALAGTTDAQLKKTVLFALSAIADPSSEAILSGEAAKAGYTFKNDNAVKAYLDYAENLRKAGNNELAERIAKSLLEKSQKAGQVHTRTAALKLLTDIQKASAVPLLTDAATDKDAEYRAAALKFAAPYITSENTALWVKKLKKSDPAVQAEIISMLGENKAETALPAILKYLKKNKDSQVKLASITAAGQIGGEQVLDKLFKLMRKGGKEEIAAVKQSLLTMKGSLVPEKITEAVPDMKGEAQAALIDVLAARHAAGSFGVVYPLVKSEDPAVRKSAYAALQNISSSENLPQLFSLLNEDVQEETEAVQHAVIAAVQDIEGKEAQTAAVSAHMQQAPENKKHLYYAVFGGIGGEKALETVSEGLKSSNEEVKAASLKALASWPDSSAMDALYAVSTENSKYQNQAVRGYIRLIAQSSYPAEQKVLLLRKAMDAAKTPEQKLLILKETEKNKTYSSLLFAGKYLDDPALQQQAAQAVMNIALSDKSFFGTIVRDYLNKTMQLLKGGDAEYQKKSIQKFLAEMPQEEGFVSVFNGKDLSGWKGLVANPIKRRQMDAATLKKEQEKADEIMRQGWKVENGELIFTGKGDNIATEKQYGDFEMLVDWKIFDDGNKEGDAGIYLRGTPQVQIWDTARVKVGAQVGSGGLYNNKIHPSKPLKVADNPLDEWNHFRIKMIGDRVTVYLNGELVTDNVILENYWDRSQPIFPIEQIELQAHGSRVAYRDIYIREIPRPEPFKLSASEKKEGFKVLFDGTNMHEWIGNTKDYVIEDGNIVVRPQQGSGGNLYTKDEYSDFVFRFEFKLTPGANNGLGIRAPMEGDAAYAGMELQILDNEADIYKKLKEYQYHGSVYGVIPAKRGYLKPVGEWNYQEVIVKGPKIKVILNGTTILDGDISDARKNGTLDGKKHPGLNRDKGHIGFLGHGSVVYFRNIRVKELK